MATSHSPFLHQPLLLFQVYPPFPVENFVLPQVTQIFYEKMWPLHILFWWKLILTATKSMFSSRPSSTYLVQWYRKVVQSPHGCVHFSYFSCTPRNSRQKAPPLEIPQNCHKSLGNSKPKNQDSRKFHIIFSWSPLEIPLPLHF